ncbi:MAG: hypothetical protein G5700_00310 [Serratia symbiotica]|nr:hypothetical protein [Serratia symbiotica]
MPLSSFCGQDAALPGILLQATLQRHFRHLAEQVIHLPQVGLGDLCQALPALAGGNSVLPVRSRAAPVTAE